MADEYRQFLMGAQICTPGTPDPCTARMKDDLLCGDCLTFVNPERTDDLEKMEYLIAAAADCPRMCPTIECRPANAGVCMEEQNQNRPFAHCFDVQ
jgi:hypothetical protein